MSTENNEQLYGRLNNFVGFFKEGVRRGAVNNFTIFGPLRDEPTVYRTFIFFRSDPFNPRGDMVESITAGSASIIDVYGKVNSIKLSDRLRGLKISEDREKRQMARKALAQLGMPHMMVALGEVRSTGEEVVSLFSIIGIGPQQALTEVQAKLKERINKFN